MGTLVSSLTSSLLNAPIAWFIVIAAALLAAIALVLRYGILVTSKGGWSVSVQPRGDERPSRAKKRGKKRGR